MRSLLVFAVIALLTGMSPVSKAQPAEAFVTTWEVAGPALSVTIPTAPQATYNFVIDWGDGTRETVTGIDPNPTHTYAAPGTYTVSIQGSFPQIYLDASRHDPSRRGSRSNAQKLRTVEQWGAIAWHSMENAFAGARHLTVHADDVPDLSRVTSTRGMFLEATSFNAPIGDWDVSSVRDMSVMFAEAASFDQPIGGWDVSGVEDMSGLFMNASLFNQHLNGWEVSNVRSMAAMFAGAADFNRDISDWTVSSVETMDGMFMNAVSFNQDIGRWDVSNVNSMTAMFAGADAFNQNIGSWNVSRVATMRDMFSESETFDQDIGAWDVSNVRNLVSMFRRTRSFDQDLSAWDISNARDLSFMFSGARSFNQDLSDWNIAAIASTYSMFHNAWAFDPDYAPPGVSVPRPTPPCAPSCELHLVCQGHSCAVSYVSSAAQLDSFAGGRDLQLYVMMCHAPFPTASRALFCMNPSQGPPYVGMQDAIQDFHQRASPGNSGNSGN